MSETRNGIVAEDVSSRLKSAEWDEDIAGRVIAARKKIVRNRALTGAALALFLAAGSWALLPRLNTPSLSIDGMISAQVLGTYQSVFTVSQTQWAENGHTAYFSEVDNLVDLALALR